MTTEDSSPRTCKICGKPEDDHPYRHAFVGVGEAPSLRKRPTMSGQPSAPHRPPPDLILRAALINRGVITVDDLTEAEQALGGSGAYFTGVAKPGGN